MEGIGMDGDGDGDGWEAREDAVAVAGSSYSKLS